MELDNAYNVGRYPGYSITNLAPFLQASYDIDAITLSGGVRYQYTENKVDDFVGYTQQQAIATGKATSADAVPGGKTDYNNFLFNAGILGRLTEQQQLWFNFSRASKFRTGEVLRLRDLSAQQRSLSPAEQRQRQRLEAGRYQGQRL